MAPRYGVVPCKRKNLRPLPMGIVTAFCPALTCGDGVVTVVQTTGGCRFVVLSSWQFHELIGQARRTFAPTRETDSGSVGTEVKLKRKNWLPRPMGTTTVICPPTKDGTAAVTGVHTAGGCRFVVLSRM